MERFFRVEAGSPVEVAYWEWLTEAERVRVAVNQFFKDNEIETNIYCFRKYGSYGVPCTTERAREIALGIVPTPKDLEKFEGMLKKQAVDGVRFFKERSTIMKSFAEIAGTQALRDLRKPAVSGAGGFYYCYHQPSVSRLFDFEGILYGSIEAEKIIETEREGIIEILGSEFYKVIEQMDAKRTGGTENGEN